MLYPYALESYDTETVGNDLIWEYRNAVGSGSFVYSPYMLRRTFCIWKELNTIDLPKDIRNLMESTYDDNHTGTNLDTELRKYDTIRYKRDATDAKRTLAGGFGTDDDNAVLGNMDDMDIDRTSFTTRKVTILTKEVYLVKSLEGGVIYTIYGDMVTLSEQMSVDDKRLLNDSAIRIKGRHISRYSMVFRPVKIGRSEYLVCVLKDGIAVRSDGRLHQDIQYNNRRGLVIRKND